MRIQLYPEAKLLNFPQRVGKARARGPFLTGRSLSKILMFLHGPGDSVQLFMSFWRTRTWQPLVDLALPFLLRWPRALMLRLKVIHRALMLKQMERLCRQDPFFTSISALLYFHLWMFLFAFEDKCFYLWWHEAHTFVCCLWFVFWIHLDCLFIIVLITIFLWMFELVALFCF